MSDPVTQNYRVFISYRRDDSAYPAQHLYAQLRAHLGQERVVFDVDSIPIGADFRTYLNEQVQTCDILLAVIGDRWLEILKDRLSEPNDFVRIEVAAALEANLLVVPILVGKASVPGENELPQDLSMLAYRNAAELRAGSDLDTHTDRLISRLDRALARHTEGQRKQGAEAQGTGAGQQPQPPRPSTVARAAQPRPSEPRTPTPRWVKPGMAALAAVIVAVAGWQFLPSANVAETTAADPIAEATSIPAGDVTPGTVAADSVETPRSTTVDSVETPPAPPPVEPQITRFSAMDDSGNSTASITEADQLLLVWRTTDATQVELRPGGPVELQGSRVVSPTPGQTTTYTLVATGVGGEAQRSVEVTVARLARMPPPGPDDPLNTPIWIEGGSFQMGGTAFRSTQPVHQVSVSGFWIQEHEVTREEYQRFSLNMGNQAVRGVERWPVSVTWREAMDYAEARGGSLATEAQWEYAARGTEGRSYPWGEAEPTCALVNWSTCSPLMTAGEVMSKPSGATPEGVYDLAGNAREWVADWYGPYSSAAATDPTGPLTGQDRVIRGGDHGTNEANLLLASYRYATPAEKKMGFRVVWPGPRE